MLILFFAEFAEPQACAADRNFILYLSGTYLCYRRIPRQRQGTAVVLQITLVCVYVPAADSRTHSSLQRCGGANRRAYSHAENISAGVMRFSAGLLKKAIIANFAGQLTEKLIGGDLTGLSSAGAWIGIISYTLQIYFDFRAIPIWQ